MNILYKEISLKNFLSMLLSIYMVVLTGGFLFLGTNQLFNSTTFLLGLALGLFSLGIVRVSKGALFAQAVMFILLFLLYGFPRIFEYLILPKLMVFPFGQEITSKQVNHGLLYILTGTVFIFVGFLAAEFLFKYCKRLQCKKSDRVINYGISPMLILFVCAIVIGTYITFGLGISYLTKFRSEINNSLIQIAKLLFNIDMIFFMLLINLVVRMNKDKIAHKKTFIITMLCSFFYILYLAFNGSRSGGLRVLSMLIAIMICAFGNFKLKLVKCVSIILILGIISFMLFPIATQIRIKLVSESYNYREPAEKVGHRALFEEARKEGGLALYNNKIKFLSKVINRFGQIDYLIVIMARNADNEAKAKYINLKYVAKSIINFFVPGEIYPEAALNTSRVFPIMYMGFTEEYVKTHGYFSQIYTAWGLAFLFCGWWGGLLALFFIGFFIHYLYLCIMKISGKYWYYCGACFLFLVPSLLYFSQGIDHSITTVAVHFIGVVSALLGFYLIGLIFRQKPFFVDVENSPK